MQSEKHSRQQFKIKYYELYFCAVLGGEIVNCFAAIAFFINHLCSQSFGILFSLKKPNWFASNFRLQLAYSFLFCSVFFIKIVVSNWKQMENCMSRFFIVILAEEIRQTMEWVVETENCCLQTCWDWQHSGWEIVSWKKKRNMVDLRYSRLRLGPLLVRSRAQPKNMVNGITAINVHSNLNMYKNAYITL